MTLHEHVLRCPNEYSGPKFMQTQSLTNMTKWVRQLASGFQAVEVWHTQSKGDIHICTRKEREKEFVFGLLLFQPLDCLFATCC